MENVKRIVDNDEDYRDQGNFCLDCMNAVSIHWYLNGKSQEWCGFKHSFVSAKGTCKKGFLRKPNQSDCIHGEETTCPYQADSIGKTYRDGKKSCFCYMGEFNQEAMKRFGLVKA